MRGSPELEWRWRGGVRVEGGGSGELHDTRALERGRELKSGEERCGVAGGQGGWSFPFYRGVGEAVAGE
jgi:hypothetical protein